MSRLRLQAQPEESKDPIELDKLLRPHPNKRGIKTRCKEDPRDKAVGSAKEQAGATVTAGNVQSGSHDTGPSPTGKEKCRICAGRDTHQDIRTLKAELKDNTTLLYFDPQKEIITECDASQNGLGACPLQDGKPVNFSSRSLIDA